METTEHEAEQKPTKFRSFQEECLFEFLTCHWSERQNDGDANNLLGKLSKKNPYGDAPVVRCALEELEMKVTSTDTQSNYSVPAVEYKEETEGRLGELIEETQRSFVLDNVLDQKEIRRHLFLPENIIKLDPLFVCTVAEYPPSLDCTTNYTRIVSTPLAILQEGFAIKVDNSIRGMARGEHVTLPSVVHHGIITDFFRLEPLQLEYNKLPQWMLPDNDRSLLRVQGVTRFPAVLLCLGPGSFIGENEPLPISVLICNMGNSCVRVRIRTTQMTAKMAPKILEKSRIAQKKNLRTKVLSRLRIPYEMVDVKPGQILIVPARNIYQLRTEGIASLLTFAYAPLTAKSLLSVSLGGGNVIRGFRPCRVVCELMKEGRLEELELYEVVKSRAVFMFSEEKIWEDALKSTGKHFVKEENMDNNYKERQNSASASYCDLCSAEVWNSLVAERNGTSYKFYCRKCARGVPYAEERFLAVQKMSYEELSALFDAFVVQNE